MLGVVRTDMECPDWFFDPVTGRRSAPDKYAFASTSATSPQSATSSRSGRSTGSSTSRCWRPPGTSPARSAYAQRVAEQLRSWWRENPFLSGVNWTSGIELGVRLINFAWIRRLLDDVAGGRRPVRAQRSRAAADPLAPGVPRSVRKPRIVGQQPRDRRGGGATRCQLRVPVVPRERSLAARVRSAARAGAGAQHVPVRDQPRAGLGLSRVRGRARVLRRCRGAAAGTR